jgi:hypothetical protein
MKRVVILTLFVVLLSGFVAAGDVAYVYRNSRNVDNAVLNVFDEMDISVDLVNSKDIRGFDFSSYDFVFIGDERLRNVKYIPDMPTILANRYYAKDLGFIGRGRVSKTAANAPLRVGSNPYTEVYDRASFKLGSKGVPYYYIPAKYQDDEAEGVAKTPNGYKRAVGDVISYLPDKCFFGIVESEYWTEDSRNMFRACVEHVYEDGVHDVEVVGDYSSSVNGIRIKDVDSGEYLLDRVARLDCGKNYKVDFKTLNLGNRVENVLINGVLGSFNWSATKVGLLAGKSTTTGSKTLNLDEAGYFDLVISAYVDDDIDTSNNVRSRSVEIVC